MQSVFFSRMNHDGEPCDSRSLTSGKAKQISRTRFRARSCWRLRGPRDQMSPVLFTAKAWPGFGDGSITVTFRDWKRSQVKVGGHLPPRCRTLALEVDAVAQVAVGSITDADARAAVRPIAAALRPSPEGCRPTTRSVRVDFHRVDSPIPCRRSAQAADLTADDVAALVKRLDRLDAASSHGPWTRATLDAIRRAPGVVSTRAGRATLGPRPGRAQARHPQAEGPRPHREPRDRLPPEPAGSVLLAATEEPADQ